jgi:hypothetical protein
VATLPTLDRLTMWSTLTHLRVGTMAHMASLTDAATVPMIVVLLVAILPEQSKFDIRTGVRCALRTARILDFGGGNGLLCRLLRDLDFDVRRFDSHAANHFAQNFEDDGGPLTKAEQLFLARALSRPIQKWVRAYLGFKLSFDAAARTAGFFSSLNAVAK